MLNFANSGKSLESEFRLVQEELRAKKTKINNKQIPFFSLSSIMLIGLTFI